MGGFSVGRKIWVNYAGIFVRIYVGTAALNARVREAPTLAKIRKDGPPAEIKSYFFGASAGFALSLGLSAPFLPVAMPLDASRAALTPSWPEDPIGRECALSVA